MSLANVVAEALHTVADAIGGVEPSAASTPGGVSAPADVGEGLSAVAALFAGLAHGEANLSNLESAVNAIQQVAMTLGLEPPGIAAAIRAAEWALPVLQQLYASGVISGGVPAAFPPGGGPGPYRGR